MELYVFHGLRVKKVQLKLEALAGGVLQSAFKNFAKFAGKYLSWSLFLIKLQAWWCATLSRKKLWHRYFSVSLLLKKTHLVEHVLTDAWVIWTKKITFTKSICRKKPAMSSYLVHLQRCGLTVFLNELHHRCFSMTFLMYHLLYQWQIIVWRYKVNSHIFGGVFQERCSKIFGKAYRETCVQEGFFSKKNFQYEGLQLYLKKGSCIGFFFCEIF